jgi:hypothetical protein
VRERVFREKREEESERVGESEREIVFRSKRERVRECERKVNFPF